MSDYSHLVCIDEKSRELIVFRVAADGRRTLVTSVPLPQASGWSDSLTKLAHELGENLLLDSPLARKLLAL